MIGIDNKQTGQNIKALMKKNGITIYSLMGMLNVSMTTVYKWRRGESIPSLENLFELAEILKVDIVDILAITHS